jgi:hypothetical protein
MNSEIIENKNNDNIYNCIHCKKIFTRKYNLSRHKNKFCKERYDKIIQLQNKYEEMKQKYDDIFNIINTNNYTQTNINTINIDNGDKNDNSNQINLTNNVNIYQYGKEDYSKIPNHVILKAIMSATGASIPCELIKKLHFNNDYPEFKNICITDKNRKYILFWDGDKWIHHKCNDIGFDMLDRCLCLISNRMEQLEKIVVDKKRFSKRQETFNKLEKIDSDEEISNSSEDEKEIQQKINNRRLFRKQASDKIEETLYNERKLCLYSQRKIKNITKNTLNKN